MMVLKHIFSAYARDARGSYAVILALLGGFLAAAASLGLTAFRVQNPAIAAEQLIDIACQKIAYADPALYPTGAAVAAAAKQALDARALHALSEKQGEFTVTPSVVDANFVTPIQTDETNADLRRYEFIVSYRGVVGELNTSLAPSGSAAVAVTKKCRPICTGMTNVVYSNATAAGHWIKNNTFKAAQFIDDQNQVIDSFENVVFSNNATNPADPTSRFVLTLLTPDGERIRYRNFITASTNIYVDADGLRQKGEPSRASQRIVVGDDDQIVVQKLNADGSLPGMCGPSPDNPCVGGGTCCVGDGCNPIDCPGADCPEPEMKCVFNEVLPAFRPFPNMRFINYSTRSVKFDYPTSDGKPGLLTVTMPGRVIRKRLAPFYVKNTSPVTINFKNGTRVTMTSEEATAIGLTYQDRFNFINGPNKAFIFHMSGVHWFYFWNGRSLCQKLKSPIVFDTEDLGQIETTRSRDPNNPGPTFDMMGQGEKEHVEWPIGKGQAWLIDNRDGRAALDMNGKRFFGDLDGHGDGYDKLRELDTSGTGILTGHDLDGLALWFDNGDAIVDDGELRSLHDVGVTAVDTRSYWKTLPDGRLVLRSRAVMNGRTIMTEDLFIAITTKAAPISASDVNFEVQ